MDFLIKYANKLLGLAGYKIINLRERKLPCDIDEEEFREIYQKCHPFTMTSKERMYSTYLSVKYIIEKNISGDFVECGVWKGGSTMIVALTLLKMKVEDKDIYLYDTFEGMDKPTEVDIDYQGRPAIKKWERNVGKNLNNWCYAPMEEVMHNMLSTGYPKDRIHLIKGRVEDTIPHAINHEKIAFLRLDTDFYESSYHELKYLYPKLNKGGILIFDDYGFWEGQKKATDSYFHEQGIDPILFRIDYSGRFMIKD